MNSTNSSLRKLYPISLLAQLSNRHATGCLTVFNRVKSWWIHIENGKLTYASSSERFFERLDDHLQFLSRTVPALNSLSSQKIRLILDEKKKESIEYADYQIICWLVNRKYITPIQAETLIYQLSKEVLASFLVLKEGNYQWLAHEDCWDMLPKFCQLDLQMLVANYQTELRNRQDINGEVDNIKDPIPVKLTELKGFELVKDSNIKITGVNIVTDYTVIYIDAHRNSLSSIKFFLQGSKFSVITINDPIKSLIQVLRTKPDIILVAIKMPNLDGYELCSLFRRHSLLKEIPIIMITTAEDPIDEDKAKIIKASGYLTRPFTQQQLLSSLSKQLV